MRSGGILLAFLLILGASCGYQAAPFDDEEFFPLPASLLLEADSDGGCANGTKFECDRILVVSSASGSRADAAREVVNHLTRAKGWPHFEESVVSSADFRFSSCADSTERRCVQVRPFTQDFPPGSDKEESQAELYGVRVSELSRLTEVGVRVRFTDCC